MAGKKASVFALMEQARTALRLSACVVSTAALTRGSVSQDLGTLDVTKLTPLSPEVISRQATINIGAPAAPFLTPRPARQRAEAEAQAAGAASADLVRLLFVCTGTIGHVQHGKSTVVKAISGVQVRGRTSL